jgi:Kdo2-lipid IVA lauroyltransferase/acyltransferase
MSLQVRIARAGLRLLGALPLALLHALGAFAGRLLAWTGTREARVARRNVELAFPALDAHGRARFLRETLAETGRTSFELAKFWGAPPERALRLVHEVRGRELYDAALAQGRGVLVAAPHLGAWELLNLYLSSLGPLTILYKAPRGTTTEAILNAARGTLGAEAVRAEPSGVRLLFRRLREGRVVGILPDQRPKGGEGEDAPFFGHPARTMTLLSRLAEKTGAPVLFAFAERLPRARGYRIHFLAADPAIASADRVAAVSALNRGLEACVALCPTQYQWTYKRFSFRAPGSGDDPVYGKLRRSRRRRRA